MIKNILENEKVFNSAQKIKYLFQPAETKTDFLVIIFSAFNPKGSPPAYNYIRTIQNLDVNKLFILDDQGERGCYYLGNNRLFDVESSVVSLITFIANQRNIPHKNIICCGSSKGGYASLYYGIKYGFGHVIVGAPQTYLGDYLQFAQEYPTLKFIAGDNTRESISFLNNLLYDIVKNTNKVPDITIHVGSGDHHYKGHVLPFKEHLQKYGFDCLLDIKDYKDHGDVTYFQKLLVDKLIELVPTLKYTLRITNIDVTQNQNIFNIHVTANEQVEFALYVYKDGERINSIWYSPKDEFRIEAKEPGSYSFIVFAKNKNNKMTSVETPKYFVN